MKYFTNLEAEKREQFQLVFYSSDMGDIPLIWAKTVIVFVCVRGRGSKH